ncbi:MAG: LON peptidase substrate-binding domain-containing protein [Bacteriovoracaceae bacterium]|nr:LON peptidase substrate-binding domain-containing protein [Bacteriovoracaceae bacterium]
MANKFLLPILPIPNVVFYPNTVLPVYIMEPSYIKMVEEAAANEELIGISMAEPLEGFGQDKTRYTPNMICSVGYPVIVEPYEEGTLKILMKGVRRVELLGIHQNLPYLIFEARDMPDCEDSGVLNTGMVERLSMILDSWLLENVSNSVEREGFYQNLISLRHIVDYLCMFLINDVGMRQILLEKRSLVERVHILNSLLRENNPYEEDFLVLNAFMNYEDIEKTYKVSH